MLQKMKPAEYRNLAGFFNEPEFARASAVLNESRDGDVYADNTEYPELVFVNTSNFSYIAGHITALKNTDDFRNLFNSIYNADRNTGKWTMKIIIPNNEWVKPLMETLDDKSPYIVMYHSYECGRVKLNWRENIPSGFEIMNIDRHFIDSTTMEFSQMIHRLIEKAYWGSVDEFLDKSGGICLVKGNEIISYSFMFYNKGDDSYELSIATDKDYRLRGLGAVTTAACAEKALQRAGKARWLCRALNEGSVRTALKAGFELVKEHNIIFTKFNRET